MAEQQRELGLGDKLIDAGMRLYDRFADRSAMPTNRRVFLESVIDRRKDPITEATFKPEELQALSNMIARRYESISPALYEYEKYLKNRLTRHAESVAKKDRDTMLYPNFASAFQSDLDAIQKYRRGQLTQEFLDLAGGKPTYERKIGLEAAGVSPKSFNVPSYIKYEDYGTPDQILAARALDAGADPLHAIQLTLGRFRYAIDPDTGGLVITDKYDFNPPEMMGTKFAPRQVTDMDVGAGVEGGSSGIYGLIRQYAGNVMPPGMGRDVRIRLNNLAPPVNNSLSK